MAAVVMNSDVRQHKRRPRINKHLTERRRRARINDSLSQIKNLVFPALENQLSQTSKVEKADILEMTLLYIRGLQRQSLGNQQQQTGDHFAAGFSECLGEVSQFLLSCDTVDPDTRMQLLNHLANRCRPTNVVHSPPSGRPSPAMTPTSPTTTRSTLYSPNRMMTSPSFSPRQPLEYTRVPTLSVDVQANFNGSAISFVTPPNSPTDSKSPVARTTIGYTRNFQAAYPVRKVEVAQSQKSPVWRPWMH